MATPDGVVILGTPGWIRASGLQSRNHQAVKDESIAAQWFCGFWPDLQGIIRKPRTHCDAMRPGLSYDGSQIVVCITQHGLHPHLICTFLLFFL